MKPDKAAEAFFQSKFQGRSGGFPIATIAYYGSDEETATKVAVGIIDRRDELVDMKRWFVRTLDVRIDKTINQEILAFLKEHRVARVAIAGRILGCPHEEGIDYPEGSVCPQCPYWARIDRWTGAPEGSDKS